MPSVSSSNTSIRAPNPQRNLYLSNPNNTLFSSEPEPETAIPPPPGTPNGLRATLRQLVPKHALFHVRLLIHQLASVPLVDGEFGVRWKFQDIHSVPAAPTGGLFKRTKDKGKERERNDNESTGSSGLHSNSSTDDTHPTLSIPSVVVSSGYNAPSSSDSSLNVTSDPKSKASNHNPLDWITSSLISPATHIASTSTVTQATASAPSLSTTPRESYTHHARGMTRWVKLVEHNSTFEHTVDAVVQMDVDRDTTDLRPNELKLVVMQRVVHGDINAPHNPRLGALYLNLAEYASSGSVSRRYLLADSKTNATLKLTIQLEHVGGEKIYKAPPLPKSEILGGITDLLKSDAHRARPSLLAPSRSSSDSYSKKSFASKQEKPYDVRLLKTAEGPQDTEELIDALFNPFVISSPKVAQTPFTSYQPPAPKAGTAAAHAASARTNFGRRDSDWLALSDTLHANSSNTHTVSGYSSDRDTATTSSASIKSWASSQESVEEKQTKPHWWQKGVKTGNLRSATPA